MKNSSQKKRDGNATAQEHSSASGGTYHPLLLIPETCTCRKVSRRCQLISPRSEFHLRSVGEYISIPISSGALILLPVVRAEVNISNRWVVLWRWRLVGYKLRLASDMHNIEISGKLLSAVGGIVTVGCPTNASEVIICCRFFSRVYPAAALIFMTRVIYETFR